MLSLRLVALLLSAPAGLLAFKDTYPLLAWSSSSSSSLEAIAANPQLSLNAKNPILSFDGLCEYDAVVVVEQPGLHASDLRSLPSTSALATKLHAAPSSLDIPYLQTANPVGFAHEIAKACGGGRDVVSLKVGSEVSKLGGGGGDKRVITIDLPELDCMGRHRKGQMKDLDAALSRQLEDLAERYPSHLVIVAGTQPSSFSPVKRQLAEAQQQRALPPSFSQATSTADKPKKTPKKTGIFHKYQLLTPALITSLVITFLLITPLVLMVVNAVATIKSPVRSDNVKQAQEKKNQ